MPFGDFNGDEHTDVFKLVERCSIELPLVLRRAAVRGDRQFGKR